MIKGQLISKGLFGLFNSPKKQTKKFCLTRLGQKLTFSSSFFGKIEDTIALFFYWPKMILDLPNQMGWVPIILDVPNFFLSGSNHFGQFQIIKISKKNLIWTWPKWFWPNQNDFDPTKMLWNHPKQFGSDQTIWTVQNHFGLIEG